MNERDIYNTQTWNFLQGDRAVESALRELGPGTTLVVRNQLGNVLGTVAGLRDLAHVGWEPAFTGPVWVPENALRSVRPELDRDLAPDRLFPTLLAETYGIQVTPSFVERADHLVLVLNMTDESPAELVGRIRAVLQRTTARLIFIAPRGSRLAPDLRPYAAEAWSTLHWEGRNAFVAAAVEEAVRDAAPRHISLMGMDQEHVFYTAIGAADYFIGQDTAHRNAQSLQLWDLLALGAQVAVAEDCVSARMPPGQAPRPLLDLVREHLLRDLNVASTAAAPRFRATGESIALDIVG